MAETTEQAEQSANPWEPVPDHVAYRACRESINALLRAKPEDAGLRVPACPDWSVRDLVAHLLDICETVRGSLSTLPPPAPPAGPGLLELLDAWNRTAETTEQLMAAGNEWHGPFTLDVFAHEIDLRQALGELPPPADHPAYPNAVQVALGGFSGSVGAHRLPAVRIDLPGAQWTAGAGEPEVTVSGSRYDLFRSATGRRTAEQIAALAWSGPCAAWLPAFTWGPFHPPAQQIEPAAAAAA